MTKPFATQKNNDGCTLRYSMLFPLAMMIASLISGCFSYSKAKQNIKSDLNDAMIALAHENRELWTRQDTIAALRLMSETTRKPIFYQASDAKFRIDKLRQDAYFTLALVDDKSSALNFTDDKIASDSIMLLPDKSFGKTAIRIQGFVDCSMASVIAISDKRLPGALIILSVLSTVGILAWRRKEQNLNEYPLQTATVSLPSIEGLKLTPMQRRFTQMLLDAPGLKVDKATLCSALWDNKINAEESLYTLVRRTKSALADKNIKIICNRGESYELRIIG